MNDIKETYLNEIRKALEKSEGDYKNRRFIEHKEAMENLRAKHIKQSVNRSNEEYKNGNFEDAKLHSNHLRKKLENL